MNFGFSDFIVCTVGLMRMIFGENYRTVECISGTAMLVSLFSILSLATILTAHPFKHRVFLNGRRMATWIVEVWLLSFYPLVKILTFGADQTLDRLIYDTVFMICASVTFGIYILTYFTHFEKERTRNISTTKPIPKSCPTKAIFENDYDCCFRSNSNSVTNMHTKFR